MVLHRQYELTEYKKNLLESVNRFPSLRFGKSPPYKAVAILSRSNIHDCAVDCDTFTTTTLAIVFKTHLFTCEFVLKPTKTNFSLSL